MQLKRRPLTGKITENNSTFHPLIQRIFAARGIDSDDELNCDLRQLHPVSRLLNVEKAAILIAEHIEKNNNILVIGDFDADGATSTAVLVRALKLMGHQQVDFLVPNRFEFGYGLTPEIVEEASRFNPHLIITVDNGISSIAGVDAVKSKGWDVLITDHHLPSHELPKADVIVNPNQPKDSFPSKNLAGVGVTFYVMLALKKALQERQWFSIQKIQAPNLIALLDLVALGTVADVVPLDKNNRILVEQGLRNIRAGKACAGVNALFQVAGKNPQRAIASDLSFGCAPRLNAAGRLDDMSVGIECLLVDDHYTAMDLATVLDDYNRDRREIEAEMKEEAMDILEELDIAEDQNVPPIFCLYNDNWHQGVIGIIASRIKEQFNRPAIIFAPADNNEIKGSARSIRGLHIRDILDELASSKPELLSKFGGHAMAAGMSLQANQLDAFTDGITEVVLSHCTDETFTEVLHSDGELNAEDFNLSIAEQIRTAAPWGQHFPEPLFDGSFEILQRQVLKEKHLKLILKPEGSNKGNISAIAFNTDVDNWPSTGEHVDLLYQLDVNEFRASLTPQMIIRKLL